MECDFLIDNNKLENRFWLYIIYILMYYMLEIFFKTLGYIIYKLNF